MDLWNSCKRLQNFSHICTMVLYFGCSKSRLIETALLSLFLRFKDISFTVVSFIMMEEVCNTDFIVAFQI